MLAISAEAERLADRARKQSAAVLAKLTEVP